MLYNVLMKINSFNVEFIQEVKYAKSFINSLLFHLQYSSDLPTIIQSIFMVNIDLCVRFVVWKSLRNGKVGTWNGITTLNMKVVWWPLSYYTTLFQPIVPGGHHSKDHPPWIFILHHRQVFCHEKSKQVVKSNYNISLPNAIFKKPLLWKPWRFYWVMSLLFGIEDLMNFKGWGFS